MLTEVLYELDWIVFENYSGCLRDEQQRVTGKHWAQWVKFFMAVDDWMFSRTEKLCGDDFIFALIEVFLNIFV